MVALEPRPAAVELALSSHPEPVVAVTSISTLLALVSGRGWGTVLVLFAVLTGQLFVGWTNDYLDREADAAVGRRDKPVAQGRLAPTTVRNAAVAALVLCVVLSLASGVAAGLMHLAAVGLATAYNLGLKATVASVVPYALAFPLLIAFITLGLPRSHLPPGWALLAAGLLGAGAHFTQALADIEADRRQGKLGLPQRVGVRASGFAAPVLLGLAAVVVAFGPAGRPSGRALGALLVSLLLVGAVLASSASGQRKLAFRLTLVCAAAIVLGYLAAGRNLA